ncbi:MAG: 4-alpha-glucanotransferase [bacterium]
MARRSGGVLLHITSLPSDFGIGDLGPWAYSFADLLAQAGLSCWQVLPVHPTDPLSGNSPYSTISSMAGNPCLVSPEVLAAWGLLSQEDMARIPEFPVETCAYQEVIPYKKGLLWKASESFGPSHRLWTQYRAFCQREKDWLEDYVLFICLKAAQGGRAWVSWPQELKWREPGALEKARGELAPDLERERILQFFFFRQWEDLREHCGRKGIRLIGDVPIYVNHDSADVWASPELFYLDEDGNPEVVAGVPPDYFSTTGQRWGNPIYRWDLLEKRGFHWWLKRIGQNLKWFHQIRIDHFRGLLGYWEIPASEPTAVKGRWVKAPGEALLEKILCMFPRESLIAEDLGIITSDVRDVMDRLGIPGMRVLQFAFSGDFPQNFYLPHNHVPNCVVYTGTHDNNTMRGWFEKEATVEEKRNLFLYLGKEVSPQELPREMIRLAMMSVAETVIVPMQDILGLGEEARMNRPSTTEGNWSWRLNPKLLGPGILEWLSRLTWVYGRNPHAPWEKEGQESPRLDSALDVERAWRRCDVSGPWPREPLLYEIHTWAWLEELSSKEGKHVDLACVPEKEWDRLAQQGLDGVWLMGVWERSPASARMAWEDQGLRAQMEKEFGNLERKWVVGSPYSVRRYVVDKRLGGPQGLAIAREMLARRGLRLILDYVPNHVALDHPWVEQHPEYLLEANQEDLDQEPQSFVNLGGRIFAHGRDPFFPPWRDTLQVNVFNPGFRQASLEVLRSIADQCDGLRCDMAMLLLDKVFKMTWAERAGESLSEEFWTQMIRGLRQSHPHLLLLAEVYWGLEEELLKLGFDLCYDKVFYDRLIHDKAQSLLDHLERSSGFQERVLRFLENHDEPRAAGILTPEKHRAAALILATVPGAKLFYHGQWEGKQKRLPIQMGLAPPEPSNDQIKEIYKLISRLYRRVLPPSGFWKICLVAGWPDNHSFQNLLAWAWEKQAERFAFVLNFSGSPSQGLLRLPWEDLGVGHWILQDLVGGETYRREGSKMLQEGLFVDLAPWQAHLFLLSKA